MDPVVAVLAILVMLIGLAGVLIPVMPGLLLVWIVAVATTLGMGADVAGWLVAGVLTVLFATGTVVAIWLPARRGRQGGAPVSSLAAAAAGAFIGFVVIPILGFLVGGFAGYLFAEYRRLGSWPQAFNSLGRVLRAYGLGVVIELAIGVVMIATWAIAALIR